MVVILCTLIISRRISETSVCSTACLSKKHSQVLPVDLFESSSMQKQQHGGPHGNEKRRPPNLPCRFLRFTETNLPGKPKSASSTPKETISRAQDTQRLLWLLTTLLSRSDYRCASSGSGYPWSPSASPGRLQQPSCRRLRHH